MENPSNIEQRDVEVQTDGSNTTRKQITSEKPVDTSE